MAEELSEPIFTPHRIKEGERFDTVAMKAYGDPTYVHTLIMDNPHLQTQALLPPGEMMWVRVKTDPETGALLPPWFADDEEVKPGDGNSGGVTPPVIEGPVVPLGFAAGYPKVEGNKISFAINKSGRYTYTVERVGGAVIFQSSGYDFSAGFALETPEIVEAGNYIVKVGPITSGNITMTGLAFSTGYPRFVEDALEIKVNRNLVYMTKVVNKTTGTTVFNANHDYANGQAFVLPGLAAGTYEVTVGNIVKEAINQSSGETSQKPSWLNKVAFTHNVDTNEFRVYVNATADTETQIKAKTGDQPSGITAGNLVWNSNTWQAGTTENLDVNYTELFPYNPAVISQGGILRSKEYRLYVRRTANPGVVYYIDFTTLNITTAAPPADFNLGNPNIGNCVRLNVDDNFPVVGGETATTFRFDAEDVTRMYFRIKEVATVVRSIELVYAPTASDFDKAEAAKPNPVVQLFYNNTPTVVYPQLTPDVTRTWEIEGSSCKSAPQVRPLVIASIPIAFASGYPRYVAASVNNNIEIRHNKSQTLRTVITETGSGTVLVDETFAYTSGQTKAYPGALAGKTYKIEVGTLSANVFIPAPVEAGVARPIVLIHALPNHIKIEITGSSRNWVLNDRSDYGVSDPYEFVYTIGGQRLRQSTPLSNYQWKSNAPVRVGKGIIKKTATGLRQWADANGITIDPTVSPGFTYNESFVYCQIIFEGGESDFYNPILAGMKPQDGQVQYMDLAPDVVLPANHGWIIQKGLYSLDQILQKGATNIPNGQLPWDVSYAQVSALQDAGKSYSDVPLNNVVFGLPRNDSIPETWVSNPPGQGWPYIYNLQAWPNGPLNQEQSENAANNSAVINHAMHVGESEEGWPAISTHWPMWGWFYAKTKAIKKVRFGDKGISHWTCHNYFTIGMPPVYTLGDLSRSEQKSKFKRPFAEWEYSNFSPTGTLKDVDMICQAIYLGAPDNESTVYQSVYFMEVARKMGKKGCMFYAEVHEWRPNNHGSTFYPDGIFYRQGKVPVDPSDSVNYSFLGHVHGHVTIHWAAKARVNNRKINPEYNAGDMFIRTGSNDPSGMPYYQGGFAPPDRYYGYNGMEDVFNMGVLMFAKTFAEVEGGTSRFLKFRIDGGAWITPVNDQMDDLIDAFYDKRGYVYSREKDGVLWWYYVNQYGAGSEHLLEVENPHNASQIWSGTIASNMVHVKRQTV